MLIGEINQKVTRFWVKCTVLRRECTLTHHYQGNIDFNTALSIRDVRGGAFSSGAGRGEDENPRGGRGGVGRGEDENPRGGQKSA